MAKHFCETTNGKFCQALVGAPEEGLTTRQLHEAVRPGRNISTTGNMLWHLWYARAIRVDLIKGKRHHKLTEVGHTLLQLNERLPMFDHPVVRQARKSGRLTRGPIGSRTKMRERRNEVNREENNGSLLPEV